MNYGTGLASLFTVRALEVRRYVYHKDIPNNKWNTFYVHENGYEEFLQPFDYLEDAQSFCDINNGIPLNR